MSRHLESSSVHEAPAGSNRREVLLGAGGLAAVAAAMGGQARDREVLPGAHITGSIDSVGTFEVLDLSLGVEGGTSGGGGGAIGKADFGPLTFTKVTDATSPRLMLALATGRPIKNASFTYATRKGSPAISYELENIVVLTFSIDENTTDRPMETAAVSFSKIKFTVDGVSTTIDLGKGTAV
jgi:type VI protein secretion system component Hcp